ncbi:MAG: RagB/SusD family nutrient uptake outer membrane protein [Prevotella sp.]|jgi:hypothetical protein
MRTKKIQLYTAALFLSLLSVSCNDYLDTTPSKGENEELHSKEQVEALFNNSDLINTPVALAVAESDDQGMSTDIYDQLGYLENGMMNGLSFNITDVEEEIYGDPVWEREYNKIFTANLVINKIDDVEDATDEERSEYLAQAHFVRAVALWNLVQTYCMPYSSQTADGLGLPLMQENSWEEDATRATLQETYDFILSDLRAARQSPRTDVTDRWWVSQPAVDAMLARFFLFTCQYDSAETYAEQALESTQATLEDYNEYEKTVSSVMNPLTGESEEIDYAQTYQYSPNELMNYPENYYSQYFQVQSGYYLIPSDDLMALYDQDNDLRYDQFFTKKDLWNLYVSGIGDDIMYLKFIDSYGESMLQSGPTVPEMLLTAAEAKARQGDISGAMETVNKLRAARMRSGSDSVSLEASTQQEAIEAILDERHREMPFVMRWWDIRRLAFNESTFDDVTVNHTFYGVESNIVDDSQIYTYMLPVQSSRYAQPIVNTELKHSNNQIVQNVYDDNAVVVTELQEEE